ncbi:ubiquitin-associated protein 1-like [Gadus macrocephalus]|uniref:ubiquitin-associated protein 1-like n=1 Tax=Gadus macrocephalus TaxID=80720 RepID=UPI0028CB2618|nr:ubiquitin-associated protein 1-like [Gadus macrocephalus]XP_059917674.1 ubiquitin-associated protein 1-like [Gadus macrocephalus]
MNSLEGVSFQTPAGSLGETRSQLAPAGKPDFPVPDCRQILRDTKYDFALERRVLIGYEPGYQRREAWPASLVQRLPKPPSCPPFSMMFSGLQEGSWAGPRRSDQRDQGPRPRSHSLNAADIRRLHPRTARFRVLNPDDEAGYSEDDEGSSTDDGVRRFAVRERSSSCSPKDTPPRFRELHAGSSAPHCKHQGQARPLSASSGRRQPSLEQSLHGSPPCPGGKHCRKKQASLGSVNKKYAAGGGAQSVCGSQVRPQQPRPSSAGSTVKSHRQKTLRVVGPREVSFDHSEELLSALSEDERELLGAVTRKGFPLRKAILALQKTAYRNPEQILSYLGATSHLCELGYEESQVEEALEMFQNSESKASEFLRVLTQFQEMGFQQSAIKAVLLVHENNRERALEELMTHTA